MKNQKQTTSEWGSTNHIAKRKWMKAFAFRVAGCFLVKRIDRDGFVVALRWLFVGVTSDK